MFDDFKDAVVESYIEKKKNDSLEENLRPPTRARLRSECFRILQTRPDKKDDETLIQFFDPERKWSNHEERIRKFDLDGFTALLTFMNRETTMRKEINIKLLAWLIDFEPRPYNYQTGFPPKEALEGNKINLEPTGFPPLSQVGEDSAIDPAPLSPQKDDESIEEGTIDEGFIVGGGGSTNSNGGITLTPSVDEKGIVGGIYWKKYKSTIIAAAILLVASIGTYFSVVLNKAQPTALLANGKESCMYWTGDHYQPIPCGQKAGDATVVGMDLAKLNGLKKIMQPDTITKNSIGKVGYAKLSRDQIEFYTCIGNHPSVYNKRLLPLTAYIYNKYVIEKKGFWVTKVLMNIRIMWLPIAIKSLYW
jgi:hypothetical protein